MRVKYINKYLVGGGGVQGGGDQNSFSPAKIHLLLSHPFFPELILLLYVSAPFFAGVFVTPSSVTNRLVSMGKGIVTIRHGRVVRLVISYSCSRRMKETRQGVLKDLQMTRLSRRPMIWLLPNPLLPPFPSVSSTGDTQEG
jgi:hypothetical protein